MAASQKKGLKEKKTPKSAQSAQADSDLPRLVINENGQVVFATDGFMGMFGCSPDKLENRMMDDILSFSDPDDVFRSVSLFSDPEDMPGWFQSLCEGTYPVKLYDSENDQAHFHFDKIEVPSGERFVIASFAKTPDTAPQIDKGFANKARKLIAAYGSEEIAQDVRKKAQKIGHYTDESELRHFLNMSNDMLSISNSEGVFLRVNNTCNRTLDYSDEELWKMNFMDLVHEDDRPQVRNCLHYLMHDDRAELKIIDFETRMIRKDGEILWTEWRQKRSGNYIYSVGKDVTAIKNHEAALRRQEQQLSEAQAIGHMGHWYWKVGAENIEWSDEIYRIFGVEKGEFSPTLDNTNDMLHRRDIGRLLQAFERAIIEKNNYEMDFRVIRPDGEIRYIRCEGRCQQDEDGDVTALFGIMQDITERTLHERDLREAKEAAEHAYAAKSQFLANMSHELRTPLNAIIGFSEMMQRQLLGPIGTEKYLDYLTGIHESGKHLLDLINDILDMSKIEAGKYELDLEEVNIAKVIRLAVHMMEGRALDADVKISLQIANEDRILIADRRALMQIILNLLSNAVKFTDPGGSVCVKTVENENVLMIQVHDTGIGIPANKLKAITRPFEQAASHYTRRHEGTGLGLAITKDLVELHGGKLMIESEVGKGTLVTIRLPYDAYAWQKKKRKQIPVEED